ncbi:MAG: PIG-L family deacetylase [Planctomycetota bacterium]|nr:PIG-L family deacetylase [Planctomycetota bacterium]
MADVSGTVALVEREQWYIDIFLSRQTVDTPPATRVLMVGPHPDDNLFGAGGTVIKYLEAGIPVHWVCVTDGRACTPDPEERKQIVEVRAQEERACAAALGLPDPDLYGFPEDQLANPEVTAQAIERLVKSLESIQPDAVFVPYFLESHPLHRYTTYLVAEALKKAQLKATVYSWAHGSFPPPSLVVDITEVFERKRELAAFFDSQLAGRDWNRELERLGRLNATFADSPTDYCEVFLAQDWSVFVPDILSRGLEQPGTLEAGVQPVVAEEA